MPRISNKIERYSIKAGRWLIGFKKKPVFVSTAINPDAINAAATGTTAVTVTGATVSRQRKVVMIPPTTLEATLKPLGTPITSASTSTLSLANTSAGSVNGASVNWRVALLKKA